MGVMVSSEVWNSKDVCAIFIKVGEQAEFHCSNIEGSSLTCFQLVAGTIIDEKHQTDAGNQRIIVRNVACCSTKKDWFTVVINVSGTN